MGRVTFRNLDPHSQLVVDDELLCRFIPSESVMMMMMNFFSDMVDRQKVFGLISCRDHC